MKTILFLLFLPATIFLSGCYKQADTVTEPKYGEDLNTWTFAEGGKLYAGLMLFDAAHLNTTPQSNNTYRLDIAGIERTSGNFFELNLGLADLNFTTKTYQSGVSTANDTNAFYYAKTPALVENIYKSSNLDPGPVMNYTITSYNAVNDVVTIAFDGKVQLENGTYADITNGKVTVKVDRL